MQARPMIYVTPEARRNGQLVVGFVTMLFWLGYQVANYWSTAEGLNLYFGYGTQRDIWGYFSLSGENWWITLLSLLVVGIDVAALMIYLANAVFAMPDGTPMVDDESARNVFFGWLIATGSDALLTWYVFAYRAEQSVLVGAMKGPEMASAEVVGRMMPWILTALSWLISYSLLQATKSTARAALTGLRSVRPPRNPGGGGGGPQPRNQSPQPQQGKGKQTAFRPVARPMPIPGKNPRQTGGGPMSEKELEAFIDAVMEDERDKKTYRPVSQ